MRVTLKNLQEHVGPNYELSLLEERIDNVDAALAA
jgi:hypothetical protein